MEATLTILKEWGVKRVKVMSLVATSEGGCPCVRRSDAFLHTFPRRLFPVLVMLLIPLLVADCSVFVVLSQPSPS